MLKVAKNLRFGFFTNGYSSRRLISLNQIRPFTVSTTEQGTIFEKNVVDTFSKFGMNLQCSGGPNDRGIDIQGTWEIDSLSIPLIIQCKNTKKAKPQYVREFVGVIGREYKNRGIPINTVHPGDGSVPLGILWKLLSAHIHLFSPVWDHLRFCLFSQITLFCGHFQT
ncbi:uncharacterized protein [Blastocystis hominis]|uniref:Restriction endonuclease type IV Mrr domain-containing protein n=1 Tax=Blastocystis hominis TaxID=12968 RepID=D8LYA3_BLAHO|nr:uncharacterized protein [Blastocystis hominis]CBK20558.2 unnamed protein product [Blastocystis hominis]|eukprot:XP_012894606.1 uncharacterized protein [Blastocystis hominis]